MTPRQYAWAAVDIVIDLAAENGIKYRRGDFYIVGKDLDWSDASGKNFVHFIGGEENATGITVSLFYDFERNGKKLKSRKDNFYSYVHCRVKDTGVYFSFSFNEIEIRSVERTDGDQEKLDTVIRKVQKLLALADQSRNPSEAEAIAASMQAQKLLAKYNLDIATVTGQEKKEGIEQVVADVGTGKKWKYTLANIVAESYCCKCFYYGSEMIVFYGFQSDVLVARRVFMYLFKVGNTLANRHIRKRKERGEWGMDGVYNSFCQGFCDGVHSELQKNCTALMLVTPQEVVDGFKMFTQDFKNADHSIDTTDWKAYAEGEVEGKRALNGQYIEDGRKDD